MEFFSTGVATSRPKAKNQVLNEVDNKKPNKTESGRAREIDIIEYVKGELFDHALFIGMSSDEYWFGDPYLFENYDNAFNRRQEYDVQMAWLYGKYVKSALESTPIVSIIPMKKGILDKIPDYAEYPLNKKVEEVYIPEEKKELIKSAKEQLNALGLLRKNN